MNAINPTTSDATPPIKQRDVQVAPIGTQTMVLRSRTWDRLKFEVEYSRQQGTTANAYLIRAQKTALIDPPGESFTQLFLAKLQQHIDLATLDYLILGHVNPNRMATLTKLVAHAPHVTLVCSRPGANTLKATFLGQDLKIISVRGEETLDLGQGHQLQFISAPTPRWPDGLCTYDPQTRILYSDKFFGAHVCDSPLWDEDWKRLDEDRRYYFGCLHAPQARQVEAALSKFAALPAACFAPGHGPLVRYSLSRLSYDYQQWCQQQQNRELHVALFYASAYGNTAAISGAIAQGLIQSGVTVDSINCELADPDEITRAVEACDGFIIGSPTLGGHVPVQVQTALGVILSTASKTKPAAVFGSYGWSGEAIALLETKLRDANFRLGFETIRVRFSPTDATLHKCEAAGREFAQLLKKTKKLRAPRQPVTEAQVDRAEQAAGRIIGSLCVVTTQNHNDHVGVLTSWVSQATFNPPGLMIAVAENQYADLMRCSGNPFVLNILKEGRNLRRHFLHHSSQNPFANLATQAATNGCLILDDALAYLECSVQNCIKCGDHWLVYAEINNGEVLEPEGVAAIQHRKSGNRY